MAKANSCPLTVFSPKTGVPAVNDSSTDPTSGCCSALLPRYIVTATAKLSACDSVPDVPGCKPVDLSIVADSAWPLLDGLYACDGAFRLYDQSGSCGDLEARMAELVQLGRATLDDGAARRIAWEVQELEAELNAVIYTVTAAAHLARSARARGYVPPDLWGPRYGFGLPFLASLR